MNKFWLLSVEKAEYLMSSLQFLLGPVGSNNQAHVQDIWKGEPNILTSARSGRARTLSASIVVIFAPLPL